MNLLFQLNKSTFKTIFRNFQEFERKRKKKSIFDISDLNVIVLDPLTQSRHFEANCGKIQYVSDPFVHLHLVLLRNICFISCFFL